MWQVELTPFSDTDRAIATSIVDTLMTPVIRLSRWKVFSKAGVEEIDDGLKPSPDQRFDPVGAAAAKDLRDCLLFNIRLGKTTRELEEARLIITKIISIC